MKDLQERLAEAVEKCGGEGYACNPFSGIKTPTHSMKYNVDWLHAKMIEWGLCYQISRGVQYDSFDAWYMTTRYETFNCGDHVKCWSLKYVDINGTWSGGHQLFDSPDDLGGVADTELEAKAIALVKVVGIIIRKETNESAS